MVDVRPGQDKKIAHVSGILENWIRGKQKKFFFVFIFSLFPKKIAQ